MSLFEKLIINNTNSLWSDFEKLWHLLHVLLVRGPVTGQCTNRGWFFKYNILRVRRYTCGRGGDRNFPGEGTTFSCGWCHFPLLDQMMTNCLLLPVAWSSWATQASRQGDLPYRDFPALVVPVLPWRCQTCVPCSLMPLILQTSWCLIHKAHLRFWRNFWEFSLMKCIQIYSVM
jgi:hypothetical protein